MLLTALTFLLIAFLALYAAIAAYAAWDQRQAGFPDWWHMAALAGGFTTAALALIAWRMM